MLTVFAEAEPGTGIRVLRLRIFAGYSQGVIVAADAAATQWVFDTRTGRRLAKWEPGYPGLNFPSGWDWHQ